MLQQLDIFEHAPWTPDRLDAAHIATREDVLKIQTAILFDHRTRPAEKIKAGELIAKIQGFIAPQKIAQTDVSGNTVIQPSVIKLVRYSEDRSAG